ncbi:MAG: hypothetical protein U0169_12730 [Polyangiaceae bacterium]
MKGARSRLPSRADRVARFGLVLAATTAGVACTSRVSLGTFDGLDAGSGVDASGDAPPSFGGDAGRHDRAPDARPTPGCDDKPCAALCDPCGPGAAPGCDGGGVFHACNADGVCSTGYPSCVGIHAVDAGDPSFVPCRGKTCGDTCPLCDTSDPNCPRVVITQVEAGTTDETVGVCGSDGVCSTASTTCP